MVKVQIKEIKNETELIQLLVVNSNGLNDFEGFQVVKYLKKHFTNEETVKIEITDLNVFFIAKTVDGRDYLYNIAYRSEVLIESGDIVSVLSTTEAKPENDFEVNLL